MKKYTNKGRSRGESSTDGMKCAGKGQSLPSRAASHSTKLFTQGPAEDRPSADRGDQQKRVTAVPATEQIIEEAVHHREQGLNAFDVPLDYLIVLFARLERVASNIDYAFCCQPLREDLAPTDPQNLRRFRAYLREQGKVVKLFKEALRLWQLCFGLKREDDWTPIVIEDMRLKAAAAARKQKGGSC